MRIWVVGTTGSGKTSFARKVETRLGIPRVEMDAINWTPAWADVNGRDREEFLRLVAQATSGEAWIIDGNYSMHHFMLPRATHLVWLDYARTRVMSQVFKRSLTRALSGKEMWPGCRERFREWLSPDHPIRWAWSSWAKRRETYEALLASPATRHLTVHRLQTPGEADMCLDAMAAEWGGQEIT